MSFGPGGLLFFYGGFMEEKVFKTLDELVDILKQRGIDIPDSSARDYAKRVLVLPLKYFAYFWILSNIF